MRAGKFLIVLGLGIIISFSCGKKRDKGTGPVDSVPPAATSDLAVIDPTDSSLTLTWTAPGDDDTVGTASQYDIRYDLAPLADSSWDLGINIDSVPVPREAGTPETLLVTGLEADTVHYFGIKTADADSNWSALSNIAFERTLYWPDTIPPAAINDLIVNDSSSTTLTLQWTATGDDSLSGRAVYYDLRYSEQEITAGNFAEADTAVDEPVPTAPGDTEGFVLISLVPATSYYLAIKAVDNESNWSGISNIARGSTTPPTDSTAPAPISDLQIISFTHSSIVVQWTATGDDGLHGRAFLYDLRYSNQEITVENFDYAIPVVGEPTPSDSGTTETFLVSDIGAIGSYYFAIKAVDDEGNASGLSNLAFVDMAIPDLIPPAPVQDLRVHSAVHDRVTLKWTAPGDDMNAGIVTSYDIRYCHDSIYEDNFALADSASVTLIPVISGETQTVTVTGLAASTNFYFALRSVDEAGNWSTCSNSPNARTSGDLVDTIPPNPIIDLRAIEAGPDWVNLAWSAPGDDGHIGQSSFYDVRYSDKWPSGIEVDFYLGDTASNEPLPWSTGKTETFIVSGMEANTTYEFALKAADDELNWSQESNRCQAITKPTPEEDSIPPAPIADLRVTDSTVHSLTIAWTCTGDDEHDGQAHEYDIRYSTNIITQDNFDSATRVRVNPPLPAGATDWIKLGNLQAGLWYQFAIKIGDESGNWSNISNVISGKTKNYDDPFPPVAISDLTVYDAEKSKVILCYTIPGDSAYSGQFFGYEVLYANFVIDENNIDLAETTGFRRFLYGPGDWQCKTIYDLDSNTVFYFMFLTSDSEGERTGISNLVSAYTRDTIPPATVTTLDVRHVSATTVELYWINPGDDGWDASRVVNVTRVSQYDIRHSTSADSLLYNFEHTTRVESPNRAGNVNTSSLHTVSGLEPLTSYYFAMKIADEQPNWSGLSNIVHAVTPEGTPPAAITDLRVIDATQNTISISWTAPGDDSLAGTADGYFLRYYTEPPTEDNFWKKGWSQEIPAPSPPGTTETYTIDQLNPHTGYYIALKTRDEIPNWSGISNIVHALTPLETDTIPPAAIADLHPTLMNSGSITLSWRAPGDDGDIGQANVYDIRYSKIPILDHNWDIAIQVNDEPSPGLPASTEQMIVGRLQPNTEYYFAVKTADTAENWSLLSNVARTITSSSPETWHNYLQSNSKVLDLDLTTQNNIVTTGPYFGDNYVSQLSLSGHLEWFHYFSNTYKSKPTRRISSSADGGCWSVTTEYNIWGEIHIHLTQNAVIREFDNIGQELRIIKKGPGGMDVALNTNAVAATAEGGYITGGSENWEMWPTTYISQWTGGFTLIDECYGGYGDIRSLIEKENGLIAYAGALGQYGWAADRMILGLMDANLKTLWHFRFGDERVGHGEALIETADGNLLIVGNTNSIGSGGWDIWLIRITEQGTILSEYAIGGAGTDLGYDIIKTADDNYLIAGSTTSFGPGDSDIYLIKVTASAEIVWEKTVGGPGNEWASSVILAPDGGFIIGGWADNSSGYIVKVDQDGNL